ncbi:CLUMA_CG004546, isoform A [Clunio marinus]|uniref:CLUMA_CG004546, isoform A n=1 Tax=Clunio marinus TaxID=568069 RepID=A0A1J1HRZ6_9DIPT|nr:CLUMA_CG004546, isoform A [Clunio marinus]
MDSKNQKIKRPKRQQKVIEDYWDCSVCTFRNTAEAFKCLMCDVRKGTSTRKPRLNSALVSAQQAATQLQFPGSSNPHSSKSSNKLSRNKNKRSKYVRLKNIDRTTGKDEQVTVNNVTIVITEYKAKIVNNRESRNDSSDYSESNDSRS